MTPAEQAAKDAADKQAKAAEEQEAKDQKAASEEAAKQPIFVVGRPGGAFNIEGEGFGSGGVLTIGDRMIETTSWEDHLIKGQLPKGAKGTIALKLNDAGITRFGVYPTPKVVVTETTTKTVATSSVPAK